MQLIILTIFFLFGIVIVFRYPTFGYMLGMSIHFNIGAYIPRGAFGLPSFFRVQDIGLIIAVFSGLRVANFKVLLLIIL